MFVSHARIRIVGLGGRSKKRGGPHRRRLAVKEVVRMPCLLPTAVTIVLGLIAVACGAGMSVIGYVPSHMTQNITKFGQDNDTRINTDYNHSTRFYTLKLCSYIGPIVMAIGMFAMIVACVFYCEILDKYAILVPDKKAAIFDKNELYEVIVGEMKKSYAQSLITAYSKAAERNLLTDNQSSSGDYLPEPIFTVKSKEPLTLEQQIDIECEGYTPSPPISNKCYSVIQARIQRLRSEDNWLKTSSLPNIRRTVSFRRSAQVGAKIVDSRTLSYDYTMDEARLRRKSMMLRSIVQWNSGSSDLFAQKKRRSSSVKALPSDHRRSFDDLSQPGHGSFPLTRLIQRRGTFACGDMRTRRMKFLLLLEASESQEGFHEPMFVDGRRPVSAIRRNSFIPYTTCDRFIAGEERKTSRDRRRSSVNPFSFGNRFGNTIPQPGTRRHSFFPIRRDDKLLISDPNEQRRHSFNPTGVSNTLRSEYTAKMEGRRNSTNPESRMDRGGERSSLNVPPQDSRFLQIPGFDPYMEARPNITNDRITANSQNLLSASGGSSAKARTDQVLHQNPQENLRSERRHSFNPVLRVPSSSYAVGEGTQLKVPKITISDDLSPTGRYLMVPPQDYYIEEKERRYSVNPPHKTKAIYGNSASQQISDKQAQQRISFQLGLNAQGSTTLTNTTHRQKLKVLKPFSDPASSPGYSQEMVVLEPRIHSDSRSVSPCSNVSCCGSELVESELSASASRNTSISSNRSVKTALTSSPVSVVAVDSVPSYGTFQSSSTKAGSSGLQKTDIKLNKSQKPRLPPTTLHLDLSYSYANFKSGPSFVRKSTSVRDKRDRSKSRHRALYLDTIESTISGPATLYPSIVTDANAAIQRSKSSSALPGGASKKLLSPQTTLSYANVPETPSPLQIRHMSQTDKKS